MYLFYFLTHFYTFIYTFHSYTLFTYSHTLFKPYNQLIGLILEFSLCIYLGSISKLPSAISAKIAAVAASPYISARINVIMIASKNKQQHLSSRDGVFAGYVLGRLIFVFFSKILMNFFYWGKKWARVSEGHPQSRPWTPRCSTYSLC